MSDVEFSFTHKGRQIGGAVYGSDYLAEFSRILEERGGSHVRSILEWGSGLSSLVLNDYASKWDCDLFITIDTDAEYQASVFRDCPMHRSFVAQTIDDIGPRKGQIDPELNYSGLPLSLDRSFDIIFIDGRRRVECAYIAALIASDRAIVILHDYRRGRYQSILGLFEILEDGPQFRILRVRPAVAAALNPGRESALEGLRLIGPGHP